MTVFLVRTYIVKPDKLDAHNEWGKKLVALMKKRPDQFAGVKSMRVLSHKYGGCVGEFTAMWGFESLADVEVWEAGFSTVKEEMALRSEFMDLVVPGTYKAAVWESVKTVNRKPKHVKKK